MLFLKELAKESTTEAHSRKDKTITSSHVTAVGEVYLNDFIVFTCTESFKEVQDLTAAAPAGSYVF